MAMNNSYLSKGQQTDILTRKKGILNETGLTNNLFRLVSCYSGYGVTRNCNIL